MHRLCRGRRFAEHTLPPRTQITPLPQRVLSPANIRDSTRQLKSLEVPSSGKPHRASLSPRRADASQASHDKLRHPNRQTEEQPPLENGTGATRTTIGHEPQQQGDAGSRHPPPAPAAGAGDDDTRRPGDGEILLNDSTGSGNVTVVDVSVTDTGLSKETRHPSLERISIPEPARRGRSPVVLVSSTAGGEPQSSPASTNGAGSSNTPGPTAGSPTTTPSDEDPAVEARAFTQPQPSTKEITDGQHEHTVDREGTSSQPDGTRSQEHPTVPTVSTDAAPNTREEPSAFVGSHPSPKNKPATPPSTTSTQKPTMHIDTPTDIAQYFKLQDATGLVESPSAMAATDALRKTSSLQDSSKRATRISSGALQKKSVSEILGETPKVVSPQTEVPVPPASRDSFQLATAQARTADRDKRDKERSKLSTVVFARPPRPAEESNTIELVRSGPGERLSPPKERDYLHTLFESKAYSTRGTPLAALLHDAHKTISTQDHLIEYQEQMNCRILKRIYQLQNANRWPLRQLKRSDEAPRPTSLWDFVLDHGKWLRTDFREERKWKLAAARGVAEWCAEWVESGPEERKRLQVRTKPPRPLEEPGLDVTMEDVPSSHPTPELVPSTEDDSPSDGFADPRDLPLQAPAAIFSLTPSDFIFKLEKTPASEKLLNELPLYQPAPIIPDLSKSDLAERLDARWKTDIVQVSKFATGKLRYHDPKPPSKRSRYDYETEDSHRMTQAPLPPEQNDVALFMPENKHIRDRIHPGHAFRPPSEHPMPTQAFFESRSSSQWTPGEDDELRKLVRDYSYNWSLISSCLTPRSLYTSSADRRTPWECFERWIGLEGLPTDMSKTPYFRAYHSRMEAAAKHVAAQIEEAQRRAGPNVQITPRKRTTQPMRVERKRTQRHLAMLDAMRKLAKKRETALQKQQHQADLLATRKAIEANQPRPPISNPAEFSKLKHEREVKMAERQEIYRQQLIAHQRATAQQARQTGQVNSVPNGIPHAPNVRPGAATAAALAMPNGNMPAPGQPRPHPVLQVPPGVPHGPLPAGMMHPKISQAQLQASIGATRMGQSPENARIMMEAARVQQQQQQLLARQHQASPPNGTHSSPNMPNVSMINAGNNPAYMAAFAAAAAAATGIPSSSGLGNGNSGSPRAQTALMGQALSSGQVPLIHQLAAGIRHRNPQMSEEEVQQLALQQLNAWSQANTIAGTQKARNQAALNAAVGAANAGAHASNLAAGFAHTQGMMTNEQVQQFNQQRMRMAQAAQRGMPPGMGPAGMMGPMTGSPVLNMVRPASQHTQQGPMSRSATPREQRGDNNGMAGGQAQGQGSPRGPSAIPQN